VFPGFLNNLRRAFAIHRIFPDSPRFAGEMMTYWPHDAERSVDVVTGCFCVARREAVREVGPLDERFFLYSEDVDWCMRIHAAGWDVRFCPEAEAVHVRAASSSAAPERFAVELQRASLQLYRKHYGWPAFTCLVALAFIYHVVRLVVRLPLYLVRPSRRRSLKAKIGEHVACLRWMLRV
jgi:GT2 family glycosyltransferase